MGGGYDLRRGLEGLSEIVVDDTLSFNDSHIRSLWIALEPKRIRIFLRLLAMAKDESRVGVRRRPMDMQDMSVRNAIKTLE